MVGDCDNYEITRDDKGSVGEGDTSQSLVESANVQQTHQPEMQQIRDEGTLEK